MLPAAHRIRRPADFSRTSRLGSRARRGAVLVHLLTGESEGGVPPASQVRIGLVVGRSVGNSVIRHRVSRRLRSVARELLDLLPDGADLVIRALPEAAALDYATLRRDVHAAVEAARGRTSFR